MHNIHIRITQHIHNMHTRSQTYQRAVMKHTHTPEIFSVKKGASKRERAFLRSGYRLTHRGPGAAGTPLRCQSSHQPELVEPQVDIECAADVLELVCLEGDGAEPPVRQVQPRVVEGRVLGREKQQTAQGQIDLWRQAYTRT